MNKSTLTLGAIAGLTSLALAVPVFAQVTGTASSSSQVQNFFRSRSLTQEDVNAMIAKDDAFLKNADAIAALHKSATQAHRDALTKAAALTNETARNEAVKAAHEVMRTTIEAAITANPELKNAMHFGMKGMHGGKMGHKMMKGPGMFAEKLGMTEAQLQAALDSGKTLQQLATEKGIELPAKGIFKMRAPMTQ